MHRPPFVLTPYFAVPYVEQPLAVVCLVPHPPLHLHIPSSPFLLPTLDGVSVTSARLTRHPALFSYLTPKAVPSLKLPIPKITDFGCEWPVSRSLHTLVTLPCFLPFGYTSPPPHTPSDDRLQVFCHSLFPQDQSWDAGM